MKRLFKWIILELSFAALLWFTACEGPTQPKYGPGNPDPNPTGNAAAVLDEVNPGEAYFNEIVTIKGSGFATRPEFNFVAFGTKVAPVLEATANELKVKAPLFNGDSVKVRVGVKGSELWSNSVDFIFKALAPDLIDEEIPWPNGVDVDADGNVYVGSAVDGIIYKITPEGEKSAFAEVPVNGSIRFGPQQYLYACVKGESKIVRVSPDGSTVEDVVELDAEPVYFDWDADRNLYIVGNDVGIFRLDTSGGLTLQDSVGSPKSCRVFGNHLYVTNIWDGQILRYEITPEGLTGKEVLIEGDSPVSLELDADGTLYYSLAWESTLYLKKTDGSDEVMYEGELSPQMRYMAFHGKYLYLVYTGGDAESAGQVFKVYVGAENAPNYGLN
jgi:sugar lactone lactonase YvrE